MKQNEYDEMLADPNGFTAKKLWPHVSAMLEAVPRGAASRFINVLEACLFVYHEGGLADVVQGKAQNGDLLLRRPPLSDVLDDAFQVQRPALRITDRPLVQTDGELAFVPASKPLLVVVDID